MCPLVLAQITAVRTREVAEAALVRLFPLVQRTDVRLQLCMRGGRVSAPIAHVRPLACVCPLVVVLCLVRREGLVAACVSACVGSVAGVAEQVP